MARTTPTVREEILTWYVDGHEHQLAVGSPAWYSWLEAASTFAFVGDAGTFTARKEPKQLGGMYWKAYRKRDGKLHHAYLGKSHDVTLERLHTVAAELAHRGNGADVLDVDEFGEGPSHLHAASLVGRKPHHICPAPGPAHARGEGPPLGRSASMGRAG